MNSLSLSPSLLGERSNIFGIVRVFVGGERGTLADTLYRWSGKSVEV